MSSNNQQLSMKEKVIQIKRETLKIVEYMLEENVSSEWFLKNCVKLCQADYDDVVTERSIEKICGYPLCSNAIKMTLRQQFRISKNKVYDITERKKFCSNECYVSSNYLKSQLQSLPLYMRKCEDTTSATPKLLLNGEKKGSMGEEVVFNEGINEKELYEPTAETITTTNLANMLNEDIKGCTEHLAGLKIKENIYKEKYVFGGDGTENNLEKKESNTSSSESEDSNEDDDKILFPEYDNLKVLSNKQMPVPTTTKKAVLIDPLRATETSSSDKSKIPIDSIAKIFSDWFTEDTMKYLLGERQVYSIKAEALFKTMVNEHSSPEQLDTMKSEYVNLCVKIDQLRDDDVEVNNGPEIELSAPISTEKSKSHQDKLVKLAASADLNAVPTKKNPVRRKTRNSSKNKRVSFASNVKSSKKDEPEDNDSSLPEPAIPLIDSISQNALRRQVLMGKFKNVYIDMLAFIDLHYRDIKGETTAIVDTFSLTPTNTIHRPKQMKSIALVLFRMLTKTKLKELHDDSQFLKLCDNVLKTPGISHQEIDDLVKDLLSPNQVLKLNNS